VNLFLGGDEDLENFVLELHGLNALDQGLGDLVFVAGIGVDNVPAGTLVVTFGDDDVVGGSGFFGLFGFLLSDNIDGGGGGVGSLLGLGGFFGGGFSWHSLIGNWLLKLASGN